MVSSFKTQLRSLNYKELAAFLKSFDLPRFRTDQILDWLHKKNAVDFSEMKNLSPDLRNKLKEHSEVSVLELVEVVGARSPRPGGETPPLQDFAIGNRDSIKYLMKTQDGHLLESVLIAQSGRRTVCVSTQLGCRIRCTFCASGKGKFGRNLTAGEIVEQVSLISRHIKEPVTNVVFMGMGEPLDNYEATMKAIEILTEKWGFGLGGRRITVSTSGLTPMIEKFVHDSRGRVRLSVSLHSSDQETRSYLVPINRKYKLDELIQSLEKIHKTLKREITFEYTLISGINDSTKEAQGVGRLAARLGAKVNLIPYNPIKEMDYKSPDPAQVELFRKSLENKNVHVTVRQTAGRDIDAACGQLRLDREFSGSNPQD